MNKDISVGSSVKLKKDIIEDNEDLPPALLAESGEVLEVVEVSETSVLVAHDWAIKEGKSFRVFRDEFDPVPARITA